MMTASTQGDTLREAVLDLLEHVPDVPAAVIARLNRLATRCDLRGDLTLATAPDSYRGRWVRRGQSNTGPGVPGIAHIGSLVESGGPRNAVARCGVRLRGGLQWGAVAVRGRVPAEWRPCRACVRALSGQVAA